MIKVILPFKPVYGYLLGFLKADNPSMAPLEPVQIIFPENLNSMTPIEVFDPHTGIIAALVEKPSLPELPLKWDTEPALYLLLSKLEDTVWSAKIGLTKGSFKDEIKDDVFWSLAVLVKASENDEPLSEQELVYLQVLLGETLSSSSHVRLLSLPPDGYELVNVNTEYMRHVLQSTMKLLFLRGYRNIQFGKLAGDLAKVYTSPGIVGEPSPVLLKLREWRTTKAKLAGEPEYLFGTNQELENIALLSPTTVAELENVPNISEALVRLHGDEIVYLISCALGKK